MSGADYVFAREAGAPGAPLLILLHGTGGNENDLIGLGRQLLPAAQLVAPRGDVSEGGALRFFRRTGEGVYDMADLARATAKLTAFVERQRAESGANAVLALGYSNGANILASLMFAAPALVDRAVLMHPLIPFAPPKQAGLAGRRVLITAGQRDPICPPALTRALEAYFSGEGAEVATHWHEGGHELRSGEIDAARGFLTAP